MIDDVDETLRRLLVRDLPVKNGEIDIAFQQPKRDWSARISRPTINVYLYDLRENTRLRGSEQWVIERNKDGTVTQHRRPARIDLRYIITAWASAPDDEHRLLSRTLMVLLRQPNLPKDLMPSSLQDQPMPVPIQVAQEETLPNPSELWNALDNESRPALVVIVTLAVDPYEALTTPIVRVREVRFVQSENPELSNTINIPFGPDVFWSIGGVIRTQIPLNELNLTLVERGKDIPLNDEGTFSIGKLQQGSYTLEVGRSGKMIKQFVINVPAPDYILEV